MRYVASLLASALLAGCQTVPAPLPPARAERLAFEIKSWGAPVHSWTVAADGTGTSVTRVSPGGGPFPPYTLEHRRFVVPADDLATVQRLVAALPRSAPDDRACQQRITDAQYGTLTVTAGGAARVFPFYAGCFDAPYAAFVGHVRAIDQVVLAASGPAPVERREDIGLEGN